MSNNTKYQKKAEARITKLEKKAAREKAVKLSRLPRSELKKKMKSRVISSDVKKMAVTLREKKKGSQSGMVPRVSKSARESASETIKMVQERGEPDPNFKLTIRHNVFAQEYIKDLSISATAKRMGASTKTLRKWLVEPAVLKLVEEEMARRARRLHMSQDEIVTELSSLGRVKITDILSFTNRKIRMKSSDELSDEVLAAIESVQEVVTKYGGSQLKVKLYDKRGALELLGRHYGMFLDRQQIEEDLTVNVVRYDNAEEVPRLPEGRGKDSDN